MIPFDVLQRSQNIRCHHMLEASAGTGKTFAIENVAARLLIEGDHPLNLEEILLVTFTKAAANDLKVRLRKNIEKVIALLKNPHGALPDYVKAIIEKGAEAITKAKRSLEQALFSYDKAQVFTIHSFCWHMLQSNAMEGSLSLNPSGGDKALSKSKLLQIVHDYLRTELHHTAISSEQLKIALKNRPVESLFERLLGLILQGAEFAAPAPFFQQLQDFQAAMRRLKQAGNYTASKIREDFRAQIKGYKGICDRKGEIKPDVLKKAEYLIRLFDQEAWSETDFDLLIKNGLFMIEAMDPSNRKSSYECKAVLHYPEFIPNLQRELEPIVAEARGEAFILARMARDCQKLLKARFYEEEMLRYDDLLDAMLQALGNPSFKQRVRERYQAAIIDEFQDTDPKQWGIFHSLFLEQSWKGFLYLVGDPKQSIYAFRQADIYTYLEAGHALGDGAKATLDVNFRSQPPLVDALNFLFESTPELIPLPLLKKSLEYRPVKAGKTEKKDGPAIVFCIGKGEGSHSHPLKEIEEKTFFPYIVQELQRLYSEENIKLADCAILVKDRHQALRISNFLKRYQVPAVSQRTSSLADSPVVSEMRELLKGVVHFRHESSLKTALGGRIIGWNHEDIKKLQDSFLAEKILGKFQQLRTKFLDEGFIPFFEDLLHNAWHSDGLTIAERILLQSGGEDFYQELQQVAETLADYQCSLQAQPEGLIAFLDEFKQLDQDEDSRMKILSDRSREAVQILTIHSSKGLEFDVVFAVGLAARNKEADLLVLMRNGLYQPVASQKAETYQKHCDEIDAEKSRQLYVAMTRAKSRLYLPVAIAPKAPAPTRGEAAPMELFLSRLGQSKCDLEEAYQRISSYDGSELLRFINDRGGGYSIAISAQCDFQLDAWNAASPVPQLAAPRPVAIPGQISYIHSFTSLSKSAHSVASGSAAPHDFNAHLMNPHTLPSGSQTGILLHYIMEILPYHEIHGLSDLLPHIEPLIENTEFKEWRNVICQMILNALETPLKPYDFTLKEISHKKIYRETEFLYPSEEGFIKGVVDLFFEHDGKYFLLDWKSNWLGPEGSFYQLSGLQQAMKDNQYYLQASLYKDAIKKYVKLFDNRPFHEIFGGAFYLFMRGLHPASDAGICYLCLD